MADEADQTKKTQNRFHGRVEGAAALCAHMGCGEPGEFRAPGIKQPGSDGPGDWRWFCLDHIREFNTGYNFFSGMSMEEIHDAQRPFAGWESETRAFSTGGADVPPRWADFKDPLDAINSRFRAKKEDMRDDGKALSGDDRRALKCLGLDANADRRALRTRYAELVRRYHPDRNGGDRSHEKALQDVISAYTRLKSAPAFA